MTHFWQGLRSAGSQTAGARPAAGGRSARATSDVAVWAVIGLCAALDAGFTLWTSFEIAWRSFLAPGSVAAVLVIGAWYYRSVRNEQRLGAIMASTAQLIGFAAVGAPLSYIAAAANLPLQDATFEAWDRAVHFDWMQMTMLIAAHPRLQSVLLLAYSSFAVQTTTTVVGLGVAGQLDRLNAFIWAFIGATLVTIAISAVWPAGGPFLFHDLQPLMTNGFLPASSTSWPVFLGLRDGTLRTLYGLRAEGIITFPSLHAAFGILFAIALWRVAVVRWIALGLNGLMLIATPAFGSHYVSDVIAGVLIAFACWIAAVRLCGANSASVRQTLATIGDPPSIVPEAEPGAGLAAPSRKLESV